MFQFLSLKPKFKEIDIGFITLKNFMTCYFLKYLKKCIFETKLQHYDCYPNLH